MFASSFDAEQTLTLIQDQRVDIVYMVPTMMQRIWNLPLAVRAGYDLSSLKVLWHLAAPCPTWLKEAFIEWLGADVIWELYGGTEAQGGTVISGIEWMSHRGSVGKPNATCEIIVVGEDAQPLPPNEIGEVFLRPLTGQGSTYRYIGAEAKSHGVPKTYAINFGAFFPIVHPITVEFDAVIFVMVFYVGEVVSEIQFKL